MYFFFFKKKTIGYNVFYIRFSINYIVLNIWGNYSIFCTVLLYINKYLTTR